jgi:hypothetical protein
LRPLAVTSVFSSILGVLLGIWTLCPFGLLASVLLVLRMFGA